MSSINTATRGSDHRMESDIRLAGGAGIKAAKQSAIGQLRRLALTALLWENSAYASGSLVAKQMAALIPQCTADEVAKLAIESREEQGLRHTPLFLLRELIRVPAARKVAGEALARVMTRPDQITEFLAIYWADAKDAAGKRKMLPHQVKKAISIAFNRFDAYQLAKYDRDGKAVGLKDALFLAHAKPDDIDPAHPVHDAAYRREKATLDKVVHKFTPKENLWETFVEGTLPVPETRETALSAATTTEAKAAAYSGLITTKKMPALAMLRSLRHMIEVGVPGTLITQGLRQVNPDKILPLNFLSAMQEAPTYAAVIEEMMMRCLGKYPKMKGKTLVLMDMSGSMTNLISEKSTFNRMDAGLALCMMAKEMAEDCTIYLTAGSDARGTHATELLPGTHRGLGLQNAAKARYGALGGGGIFTRQALEYVKAQNPSVVYNRIIVISDSQDCDRINKVPKPFAKFNYIADVSSHRNGINYEGVWTAEISGWSQAFLHYVAEHEAITEQYDLFRK